MSDKPSYLGLLNAIAVAEGAAEEYLRCWAAATSNDEVRSVISAVAIREGEHAKAFEKRICELGYGLRTKETDPAPMEVAASTTLSDREKFEKLRLGQEPGDAPDVFAGMFADTTIDIQTGALLGRYIAEERDSGRLLRSCYQQLCQAEAAGGPDDGTSSEATDLAAITDRLDRIEASLAALADRS
jgi:hypothetical protein